MREEIVKVLKINKINLNSDMPYIECETSIGIIVFWGDETNKNISTIKNTPLPFTARCKCISPNDIYSIADEERELLFEARYLYFSKKRESWVLYNSTVVLIRSQIYLNENPIPNGIYNVEMTNAEEIIFEKNGSWGIKAQFRIVDGKYENYIWSDDFLILDKNKEICHQIFRFGELVTSILSDDIEIDLTDKREVFFTVEFCFNKPFQAEVFYCPRQEAKQKALFQER